MQNKRYLNGFRGLKAWQEAKKLAVMVYSATRLFPKDERFGLISQLRRAAASVGALIAEGSYMKTAAHQKSFYERGLGSTAEIDHFLELSLSLNYLDRNTYASLLKQLNITAFLLKHLSDSCAKRMKQKVST